MSRVFIDTSYVVALFVERDAYHTKAIELAARSKREQIGSVTTEAVLCEIGNSLADPYYRTMAATFIERARENPTVEVTPFTTELFQRGLQLYKKRPDKSWGLVDCTSFIVMRDRELSNALTTDKHFEQAGFNVLLRE